MPASRLRHSPAWRGPRFPWGFLDETQPIWLLLLACVLGLAGAALRLRASPSPASAASRPLPCRWTTCSATSRSYRRETWRWQRLMGMRTSRAHPCADTGARIPPLGAEPLAQARAHAPAQGSPAAALAPPGVHPPPRGPLERPEPPYYGGLQMDLTFQRMYGARPAAPQGHGRQLDAGRADVGRRACATAPAAASTPGRTPPATAA